jgi:hypothetical protein
VNRHPLTPELIDGIARAVRAGNYWEASAANLLRLADRGPCRTKRARSVPDMRRGR